jgi:uncharacterized protein
MATHRNWRAVVVAVVPLVMFVWNMLGALVLIPALSHFLLRHVGESATKRQSATVSVPQPVEAAQRA